MSFTEASKSPPSYSWRRNATRSCFSCAPKPDSPGWLTSSTRERWTLPKSTAELDAHQTTWTIWMGLSPSAHRRYAASAFPLTTTLCRLEGAQERHQILLLLRLQFRAEDQVEELDRILQRQQTLVVQVGRVVLDAAQHKGFDQAVADGHHVVDHHRLEEPLGLEVVHRVVGVKGRLVAVRALALAEEDLLATHLGLCRLGGIELAIDVELGCRRKVQHLFKIGHEVDRGAAREGVRALLRGDHNIAVEIGGALLEFGEILDRLQGTLRAEEPLSVQAAERHRPDAVAELLRTGIGSEVRRAVLVAVRMAIKACRADAGNRRAAIVGGIELLLREGRQQQAQPFQLPRRDKAVEQSEVIRERDQLALRDIAQVGAGGQVDGWRKRGQEAIRQIEIDVEPGQVSPVLLLDRVDLEVRKDEAALGMVGMRQGVEPLRIEIVLANLVRAHRRQPLPGHPGGQFDADAFLHGFSAIHRDPLGRAVAQIVALV